ncbi:hypothetical protein [Mesorhizobium sp.]|uniref:hypothetical protein n=1 Tax=Mesorhizobium sp. TaxID=1871066 RepID=UPI003BABFB88
MAVLNEPAPARGGFVAADRGRVRLVLFVCLATLAVAPFWQARWGVIPDTSWIITVCERVLAGDRLYADLIETNPPFSVWLYLPAVYLAKQLGVAPEYIVHAYAYAVCLFGLGFAVFVARRARLQENPALLILMPAFLALLVLFPGNSFSEREHLGVALLLPLLVLTAWRASHGGSSKPEWWLAALVGLSGSVMLLVKPYYALTILAPALWIAWRQRSIKPLFAIEYWVIGGVCLGYLAAILLAYPEFLRDVYPRLADTYMRYKVYSPIFIIYGGIFTLLFGSALLLRGGRALSPMETVLMIASAASVLPLIYQGKGWAYHAYPAVALVVAAVLCLATERATAPDAPRLNIAHKVLLPVVILISWLPFLIGARSGPDFVASIHAAVDHPTVGQIGPGIEIGHPLTRMIGGRWISAYCSDWLGNFAAIFARQERAQGNMDRAAHYDALERDFLTAKIQEFVTGKPDLIFVQKSAPFWVDRVMKRDDFAKFMDDYRTLAEDQNVRVYLRNGSGKVVLNN